MLLLTLSRQLQNRGGSHEEQTHVAGICRRNDGTDAGGLSASPPSSRPTAGRLRQTCSRSGPRGTPRSWSGPRRSERIRSRSQTVNVLAESKPAPLFLVQTFPNRRRAAKVRTAGQPPICGRLKIPGRFFSGSTAGVKAKRRRSICLIVLRSACARDRPCN